MVKLGSLFYPSVDFMSVFVDNTTEIPSSCLLLFQRGVYEDHF